METISNQASVSYSYEGSTQTYTNNSNIVNSSMREEYNISVAKTSTVSCFRAGDTITYMVVVKNEGCNCLGRYRIVDVIENSEYLTYISGSARLFINGSMQTINPTDLDLLTFEFEGRLNRDSELILQYNVRVSPSIPADIENLVNRADVRAYPCDCNDDSENYVEGSSELTIPKCEFAELLITKSVSNDNFCCGEELDYFITLTNTGTIDATNIIVTDNLPQNFTLIDIESENNGVRYKYDASEYDLTDDNLLTLPNETGTAIYVPAVAPGVDNSTRIKIHGHM